MTRFQEDYKTLKESLDRTYRVDQLKSLASQISQKIPTRKADLVDHITLTTFKDLEGIVAKLSALSVSALAESVYNWGGFYREEQFYAKYNAYPIEPTRGRRGETHLLHLFFTNGIIPDDLLESLKDIIDEPMAEKIHYCDLSDSKELIVKETANAASVNLHTLLSMVAAKKIRVSPKTGRASSATIKAITAVLYDGDFYEDGKTEPIQAFAWPLLIQGGGLAAPDGNFLKLTKKGEAVLKKDLAAGIKLIWKKWEKTRIIDEYSRIKIVKGQNSSKGRTMTSPVKRRPLINDALSCLEPGKWVTIDEIARFIRSENYSFQMTNYDWKLYFADANYGLLDHYDTWPFLQLRYLLAYFFEYCATLGILDIAFKDPCGARNDFRSCWGIDGEEFLSMYDGLMKIRLNELGAYVFEHTTEYALTGSQEFENIDTAIRYIGAGTPAPDIFLYLDKVAEQKEVHQWDFSLSSLLNALKLGETLKEIKAFIKKITSEKPDPSLLKLFEEVHSLSTAVVEKGNVTLLECHLQTRKQILTDKKLSRLCMPAGDRHIVILPGKNENFVRQLEALGMIIGK